MEYLLPSNRPVTLQEVIAASIFRDLADEYKVDKGMTRMHNFIAGIEKQGKMLNRVKQGHLLLWIMKEFKKKVMSVLHESGVRKEYKKMKERLNNVVYYSNDAGKMTKLRYELNFS